MTFLQFEDGSAASLVFSGYDRFDSDEFHFWVGESGEEKSPERDGRTYAAYVEFAERRKEAEAALKRAHSYGGSAPGSDALDPGGRRWHHMHFGVTIASCADGDIRAAADSVELYGRQGRVNIPVGEAQIFPDKSAVIDELYDAVVHGQPACHDGRWGKATVEICEAILTSARERCEVNVKYQVPLQEPAKPTFPTICLDGLRRY
jgi:phthalate 4,5-cis-dihydrodiol dehydrogenase